MEPRSRSVSASGQIPIFTHLRCQGGPAMVFELINVVHQENAKSASAKLEALGNSKITWTESGFIQVLRSASGIDSQLQAHGRTAGLVEALG
jgi:hypothetical protein